MKVAALLLEVSAYLYLQQEIRQDSLNRIAEEMHHNQLDALVDQGEEIEPIQKPFTSAICDHHALGRCVGSASRGDLRTTYILGK